MAGRQFWECKRGLHVGQPDGVLVFVPRLLVIYQEGDNMHTCSQCMQTLLELSLFVANLSSQNHVAWTGHPAGKAHELCVASLLGR